MIRTMLGGLVVLAGLLLTWHWLLQHGVSELLAPLGRVSTLELDELRRSASEPVALARETARRVEESLEAPGALQEPELLREPEVPHESGALPEPGPSEIAPAAGSVGPEPAAEPEPVVDAALIRRMLAVYARTVSPE